MGNCLGMDIEPTKIEKALWDLLDDIDTAFDRFKPRIDPFEQYVMARVAKRHQYLISDGHSLRKTEIDHTGHGQ